MSQTMVETAQEFIARKTLEFQQNGKTILQWSGNTLAASLPVEAITFTQDKYSGGRKVFLLERFRDERNEECKYGYRVSYYMMNGQDEWTWMRGCPMFSRSEHDRLYAQATLDGTYI
jgi:hypothetical protein